jgi:uncharacterized protein
MTELPEHLAAKRDRLLALLQGYGSCAVGFSGGLDSSVLACAAQLALGDQAVAVTGSSPSLAAGELDQSVELARQIGIRHELMPTHELEIPEYRENTAQRCYYCKMEIINQIEKIARRLKLAVVVDGSNRDDHGEHRPGIRAARERNVRSPLAECDLTKAELRQLAQHWGLPTWEKPPTPCLSSRIAYGEEITPDRLRMVDRAESFLRSHGFQPLRVRYHKDNAARIEVSLDQLPRLAEPQFRRQVVEQLKSLGFRYVSLDLEGFRSGSLNAVLPTESLDTEDSTP